MESTAAEKKRTKIQKTLKRKTVQDTMQTNGNEMKLKARHTDVVDVDVDTTLHGIFCIFSVDL